MDPADDLLQIGELARAVLAGDVRPARAAEELVSLRYGVSEDGGDPDFWVFFLLYSDLDGLPVRAADSWSATVIPNLEERVREVEDFYRSDVLDACRRLAARFPRCVAPTD